VSKLFAAWGVIFTAWTAENSGCAARRQEPQKRPALSNRRKQA